MSSFNDNSLENIYLHKKIFSLKNGINKVRKNSLELTKGSNDSNKIKEKSNINEFSYKKIKKIKDIMPNNNNNKETICYQNSYFPICLSFMTNAKNYPNSMQKKFKIRNRTNLFDSKTIGDFSTFFNNSMVNNNNNNNISVQNKNYKKINLNINFESAKDTKVKIPKLNINNSPNSNKKFKLFEPTGNKSVKIKNYNYFIESFDKSINIYNPKKKFKPKQNQFLDNKTYDENEEDEQLRQKINEVNRFVSLNLSKKKLQLYLRNKINNSMMEQQSMENKEPTRQDSLKIAKNLKKSFAHLKRNSILMPKLNNSNTTKDLSTINKQEKSNKNIVIIHAKEEERNNNKKEKDKDKEEERNNSKKDKDKDKKNKNKKSNEKRTNTKKDIKRLQNIDKNDTKENIDEKENENKFKREKSKKRITTKLNTKKKISFIKVIQQKQQKKTPKKLKIKFNNLIFGKPEKKENEENEEKEEKNDKKEKKNKKEKNKKEKKEKEKEKKEVKPQINDINMTFLNEIKEDNDKNKKHKKLDKEIKQSKISKLLSKKSNIDKLISKKKEKMKAYNSTFNLSKEIQSEKISLHEIYRNKMRMNSKMYLELKKISILYNLLYGYIISFFDKCSLDNNMINYVRLHVEFSSIYLPVVKFGDQKSILITDKLFSFKNNNNNKYNNLLQMVKSKFVEKKKYKKGVQIITLNFIIKELQYYNTHIEELNFLEEENSEKNDSNSSAHRKTSISTKKVPFISSNMSIKKKGLNSIKRRASILRRTANSSSLSLLEKKKFYDISKKGIENKLKYSLNSNLLIYKLNQNNIRKGSNIKDRLSKQYLNKAITLIHENKIKREANRQQLDYFELLRKITGKENIEIILRAFIKEGETILFSEYFNNNYRRIDINSRDDDGNTFLILSIKQGLNYITKSLLEKGVDVNIQNNEGNSALHFALSGKNFVVADLLKKYGAKEDCYNALGYTPWDCVGKSIDMKND